MSNRHQDRDPRPTLELAGSTSLLCFGCVLAVLSVGCVKLGAFACLDHAQCEAAGEGAMCLEPGYCAVRDSECPSGYRFVQEAASPFAGGCVDIAEDPDPDETSSAGGSSSTTHAATWISETEGSETTGVEDPSTDDSTDDVGGSSSSGGDACGDDGCDGCALEVAAGPSFTCALRTDGQLVCWGANSLAQLGDGVATTLPQAWPQLVQFGDSPVVEWGLGNAGGCARTEDGAVWCWGRNLYGEVDPASTEDPLAAQLVDFVSNSQRLVVAGHSSCSIDANGVTTCWGRNHRRQLMDADTDASFRGPTSVSHLGPGLVGLSAGLAHACWWDDADLACWGSNRSRQLAQASPPNDYETPQVVTLAAAPQAVAAGYNHTCALDGAGDLWCWGSNAQGQLGVPSVESPSMTPERVEGIDEPIASIVAREHSICALTEARDEIFCWGNDRGGSLGTALDDGELMTSPQRVIAVEELPAPIMNVALGHAHLCAVVEGHRLFCWGRNNSSQLGPMAPPAGHRTIEVDVCPALD